MELIDREEAKKEFNARFGGVSHAVAAGKILDEISEIDPVHAAGGFYCCECGNAEKWGDGNWCKVCNDFRGDRDFCSRGKPKVQEEDT